MIQEAIRKLVNRQDLDQEEARQAMTEIMDGATTPAQTGAFLAALAGKGETVEEVTGCALSMRAHATPVRTNRHPLVDTCGTGGDGSQTFNISTTVAFVLAGAGAAVAKHGNRSATSRCGSADVLEALGVDITLTPEAVGKAIDEVGIGFLFAPALHGAMRHAAGPRRELAVPTVFNMLGPLTNPAGADRQIIGVARERMLPLVAGALRRLGTHRAFVVHGAGSADEVTLSGVTQVVEVSPDGERTSLLDPQSLGLGRAPLEALRGGGPEENAKITLSVLSGETGPRRDVVLVNSALALRAAGLAGNLEDGIAQATQAIDSGRALGALEALRQFSRQVPA